VSDGVVLRPLERLDEGVLVGLVELLVATVDAPSDDRRGAASIGFLPPLAPAEAEAYWRGVRPRRERLLLQGAEIASSD
jgi:hypothetical protein